jgi:hypothetical protein
MKKIKNKKENKIKKVINELKLSEVEKLHEEKIIKYILKIVENYYKVNPNYVTTNNRRRELVFARQVSMYLIFKYSTCSLKRIGEVFNGKDHSTVVHAKKTVLNLMQIDKEIKNQIDELKKIIEINIKAINENFDLSNGFYYVDFNKCYSMIIPEGKAIMLTGFNDEEINDLKLVFKNIINSRKHENTGLYILENL